MMREASKVGDEEKKIDEKEEMKEKENPRDRRRRLQWKKLCQSALLPDDVAVDDGVGKNEENVAEFDIIDQLANLTVTEVGRQLTTFEDYEKNLRRRMKFLTNELEAIRKRKRIHVEETIEKRFPAIAKRVKKAEKNSEGKVEEGAPGSANASAAASARASATASATAAHSATTLQGKELGPKLTRLLKMLTPKQKKQLMTSFSIHEYQEEEMRVEMQLSILEMELNSSVAKIAKCRHFVDQDVIRNR